MTNDLYQPPAAPVSASYASGDGQISPLALQHLVRTQPWVRLISIVGLIGVSIWLISMILAFMGVANLEHTRLNNNGEAGYLASTAGMFLAVALFYIYPLAKLSKYAAAIRRLRLSQSMFDFEVALDQQRGFWRFVGIITLICVVFGLIALLGVFGALAGR